MLKSKENQIVVLDKGNHKGKTGNKWEKSKDHMSSLLGPSVGRI